MEIKHSNEETIVNFKNTLPMTVLEKAWRAQGIDEETQEKMKILLEKGFISLPTIVHEELKGNTKSRQVLEVPLSADMEHPFQELMSIHNQTYKEIIHVHIKR